MHILWNDPNKFNWYPLPHSCCVVTATCGNTSGSVVNDLPASIGDTEDAGSIPGLGRSSGGEKSNPL